MAQGDSIDKSLLQTFVPVNALTGDHLDRLLDQQKVVHYTPGQVLFSHGDEDAVTIYLLKGDVEMATAAGEKTLVSAGGTESWHPLDHAQPRRVTCTAVSDVSVVQFDSGGLDSILAWDQSAGYVILDINSNAAYQDDRHWMIRLLKSKIFYKVPPGNILEIFRRLKPSRYKAGDWVITQGDEADCFYIIKEIGGNILSMFHFLKEAHTQPCRPDFLGLLRGREPSPQNVPILIVCLLFSFASAVLSSSSCTTCQPN